MRVSRGGYPRQAPPSDRVNPRSLKGCIRRSVVSPAGGWSTCASPAYLLSWPRIAPARESRQAVDVHVVVGRMLADVLDQAALDLHAIAERVCTTEGALEQRHDDRSRDTRRRFMDVGGDDRPVDVLPAQVEADSPLTLVKPQVGLAGCVGVAGAGRLLGPGHRGRQRPAPVLRGGHPRHGQATTRLAMNTALRLLIAPPLPGFARLGSWMAIPARTSSLTCNGNRVRFEQDSEGAWRVHRDPKAASSGSDEVVQPE